MPTLSISVKSKQESIFSNSMRVGLNFPFSNRDRVDCGIPVQRDT